MGANAFTHATITPPYQSLAATWKPGNAVTWVLTSLHSAASRTAARRGDISSPTPRQLRRRVYGKHCGRVRACGLRARPLLWHQCRRNAQDSHPNYRPGTSSAGGSELPLLAFFDPITSFKRPATRALSQSPRIAHRALRPSDLARALDWDRYLPPHGVRQVWVPATIGTRQQARDHRY